MRIYPTKPISIHFDTNRDIHLNKDWKGKCHIISSMHVAMKMGLITQEEINTSYLGIPQKEKKPIDHIKDRTAEQVDHIKRFCVTMIEKAIDR